ncbi:hypothetical protein LTR35_005744 [Friedmanniomyces endolithicus]|uniref:Uncharacterized protein n=1 Tax=Friedmanniomyces endolithicus TaxID=329885 RepID=A0AAN6FP12_9PEZI|nr:hypothetical protein LTR35_005744 [Friedmanniomyces endolithicus]KAK0297772.1 hypothetical protein LTS00_003905 [Friedmanniomyces endolithicus]KAK0321903.1 hypothetical protein LTR82_006874 [Friedmanniomyces endolithicus]KAK0982239.1 hypothetical protein LTR54_014760 [Friedmanniomyces endolithicus]
MSLPGDRGSGSDLPGKSGQQQPLFIVSDQGRHTEESRRIVRAQAARASAAQSRVTRARNRGEREGTVQAAPENEPSQGAPRDAPATESGLQKPFGHMPLAGWLPCIIGGAAGAVVQQTAVWATGTASSLPAPAAPSGFGFPKPSIPTPLMGFQSPGSGEMTQSSGEASKFQLPVALPRGFATLQKRIPVSEATLSLVSRTACIDFASPEVEQRLHQLLFDLIANVAGAALTTQPGHPLQSHLRVACTCLTIFQGQRANGQVFAQDQKYQVGLEAAWSEAMLLDQTALDEPKSAEASLWAVFMIMVTTGATATFFHKQLHGLLQDLQLRYWEQVRKVLLDFIYPVSFLDDLCKSLYDTLQTQFAGASVAAG